MNGALKFSLVAVIGTALLSGGTVFGVYSWATGIVDATQCAKPDSAGATPPGAQFYKALDVLDRLSGFPIIGESSRQRSDEAVVNCLSAYTSMCTALRDDAVEGARRRLEARLNPEIDAEGLSGPDSTSWRDHLDEVRATALCTDWTDFNDFLASQDVDAIGACPVCAPAQAEVDTPDSATAATP